jgi:hypothetical protein
MESLYDEIPDEVVMLIFSYLPIHVLLRDISRVNRLFRRIVAHSVCPDLPNYSQSLLVHMPDQYRKYLQAQYEMFLKFMQNITAKYRATVANEDEFYHLMCITVPQAVNLVRKIRVQERFSDAFFESQWSSCTHKEFLSKMMVSTDIFNDQPPENNPFVEYFSAIYLCRQLSQMITDHQEEITIKINTEKVSPFFVRSMELFICTFARFHKMCVDEITIKNEGAHFDFQKQFRVLPGMISIRHGVSAIFEGGLYAKRVRLMGAWDVEVLSKVFEAINRGSQNNITDRHLVLQNDFNVRGESILDLPTVLSKITTDNLTQDHIRFFQMLKQRDYKVEKLKFLRNGESVCQLMKDAYCLFSNVRELTIEVDVSSFASEVGFGELASAIVKYCPVLQKFTLSQGDLITVDTFNKDDMLYSLEIVDLLQKCPSLHTFRLLCIPIVDHQETLDVISKTLQKRTLWFGHIKYVEWSVYPMEQLFYAEIERELTRWKVQKLVEKAQVSVMKQYPRSQLLCHDHYIRSRLESNPSANVQFIGKKRMDRNRNNSSWCVVL